MRRFPLGRIVATRGALATFSGAFLVACLRRHMACDWGCVDQEDKEANERALSDGSRLLSAFIDEQSGERVWVITEADRSSTCMLRPDEY